MEHERDVKRGVAHDDPFAQSHATDKNRLNEFYAEQNRKELERMQGGPASPTSAAQRSASRDASSKAQPQTARGTQSASDQPASSSSYKDPYQLQREYEEQKAKERKLEMEEDRNYEHTRQSQ